MGNFLLRLSTVFGNRGKIFSHCTEAAVMSDRAVEGLIRHRVAEALELIKAAAGTELAVARIVGVSRRTLFNWKQDGGSLPKQAEMARLAAASGKPVGWFYPEDGGASDAPDEPAAVLIPIVDARAAAGHGAFNDHAMEIGRACFPREWLFKLGGPECQPERCDFLRISGDSMSPSIADGALALIDRSQTTPPAAKRRKRRQDDDIFVFIWECDLRCKRLARLKDGSHVVFSDNSAIYPLEIVAAHAPMKILGRVIWWDNRL